ncbi:hypothetical protein FGG08_001578 [Glutinoglossum americanum]|uniref:Uncharacterized protein n=1 Tax=Glutinoglossum americanum TaxID=1670608 RepID=A0A9P8IAY7_9PEZI|nr:hypothetical protein FGG08_001578 [Glutinoglossum americanum]
MSEGADEGRHSNREGSSSLEGESEDDIEDYSENLPEDVELVGEAQSMDLAPKSAKHEFSDRSITKGQSPSRRRRLNRTVSEPSLLTDRSPSPSVESSMTFSGPYLGSPSSRALRNVPLNTPSPDLGSDSGTDWSLLSKDLQFYLNYHRNHLTFHHYLMLYDAQDFLRTTFLDMAVKDEPLLYAVAGFSAFHHTITLPDGRIQAFLTYYDKSVSLLLLSLRKNQRHTASTLLAILQLASFEEYLGDWVNLLMHQKAAHEILTELYDPHSVMQSPMRQVIFHWYSRFAVFAGLMSGRETVLGREWFSAAQQYYQEQVERYQDDVCHKIEEAIASLRLIAVDMSILFAKRAKESIRHDEFVGESDALLDRITGWRDNMHPSLRERAFAITSFNGAPGLDSDDIVDPYVPGILFGGPIWTMNFVLISWYTLGILHRYQTALALQRQLPAEVECMALQTCQLAEAIELYPESPPGAALAAAQTSLTIASLFLPMDDRHTTWALRKFSRIEQLGYTHPPAFRAKMSERWNIPSIKHSWSLIDESCPEIIHSIRSFVEDRARTAPARDVLSKDVADMKAVFGSMKLEEGHNESSSSQVNLA